VQVAVQELVRLAEMPQAADLEAVVRADRERPPALQEPILFTVAVVAAVVAQAATPLLFQVDQEVLVAVVLVVRPTWLRETQLVQRELLGQTQIQTPVVVVVAAAIAIMLAPIFRVRLPAVVAVQE
jgi:hypothetical protein